MTGRTAAIAGFAAAALAAGAWFLLAGGAGSGLDVEPVSEETAAAEEAAANAGLATHAAPKAAEVAKASYRIRGLVVDVEGAPVAGVRVSARRTGAVYDMNDPKTWAEWGTAAAFARTTKDLDTPSLEDEKGAIEGASGEDGAFLLEPTETGSWQVTARPEPPRVGGRGTAAVTAAKPEAKVRLVVATGSKLVGRVVDAADQPVAAVVKGSWTGTSATSTAGQWFQPQPVRTDAGGGFAFDAVPAGKGTISLTLPGRMSLSGIEVVTPYDGTLLIRLGGGGVLRGRVLDLQGAPVAGADVVATVGASAAPGSREPTSCRPRAKTGPDGAWRVEGVLPGRVSQMSVSAPGYTLLQQSVPRAAWAGAEVRAGQETAIDLVVKKGGAVAGRVTEAGARTPIEGVEVRLLRSDTNSGGMPPTTVTDADGRFRFEDVPIGKHVLLPQSPTHWSPEVEAAVATPQNRVYSPDAASVRGGPPSLTVVLTAEGETAERDFEMRRGLTVKGRVVGPDGAGVEGAKVRSPAAPNLQWQWGTSWLGGDFGLLATSGADGRFEARGLAPREDWVLSASKESFLGKPCEKFALSAAAPAPEVVLELQPGASVAGKVFDADGKPAAGWNVWYWAQEAQNFQQNTNTTTDPDGAFLVQGLPPGKGQVQVNGVGGTVQKAIDALATGEKRTGVEVRAEKAAEISGTVVDAEGKAVPNLSLTAQDESGRGNGSWGSTRADGTFTINGRLVGKTRVLVNEQTDQGYSQSVPVGEAVQAPASGLRLVYTPKKRTTITGRVVDPAGRPVPLCVVSSGSGPRNYGGTNPDEAIAGEFVRSLEGSPPYTLSVSAPRDARGRPMNLRPRQVTVADPKEPVLVTLEAGLEVAGQVTGPDGKGVIGVTLRGGNVSCATDEEGKFRLGGLANEADVEIAVQAPARYAPAAPVRAKTGAKDVLVRLTLGAAVAGRVVGPDGKGLPNAGVNASWKSAGGAPGSSWASSGADGAFRIEGLPDDALLTLDVNLWGNEGTARFRPIHVTDVRAGTTDLVVRMEAGATIEGRVVHPDGSAGSFSWVLATREDKRDGNPLYGQPGTEGAFTIGGCEPGVAYLLKVHGSSGNALTSDPVRIEAPARNVRVVVLPPAKLTGRLEGVQPGASYWIQGRPVGAEADTSTVAAQVGPDGTFSIDVAADKDYLLYASSMAGEDRCALAGPVRAGTGDVVLRWQTALSIEGRVDDLPTGDAWVMAKGDRCHVSAKVEEGRFRLRGLPPGRYALSLYAQSSQSAADSADAGTTGLQLRWQPK